MKAVDLRAFRLLLENAAVKQVRIQRAPMSGAWHLVLTCTGGDYAYYDGSDEPCRFCSIDAVVDFLEAEGVSVASLSVGARA